MSEPPATVSDLLRHGRRLLDTAGVESSGLDAEVLLRHVLMLDRSSFLAHLSESIPKNHREKYQELIQIRMSGVPVAYLTGEKEFYGRTFSVSRDILVPRPETEHLVEEALDWLRRHPSPGQSVVDVGTGSGAIAISIACDTEHRHRVVATDIALPALRIARENARHHGADIEFVCGSLLDWCESPFDLIVVNLPYLRPDQAHDGIRFEPAIALFAGEDGFELNRRLIEQAAERLANPGRLIMEIDPDQAQLARQAASSAFGTAIVRIGRDLAGLDRYLVIERNGSQN